MSRTILFIGTGVVGSWALEFLARQPGVEKIVVADKNEDFAYRRANAALCGSSFQGFFPEIEFKPLNLFNVEETATLLKQVNPELVYSVVTLTSAYAAKALSPEKKEMVEDAGLGQFLSTQLILPYNLARAMKEVGIAPYFVNTSLGDAVSPILKRVGLKHPDLGVGNLDTLSVFVRLQVARKAGVNLRDVKVYHVGHHANNVWFSRRRPGGVPPYYLKILVKNEDVTSQYDTDELMLNTSSSVIRLGGNDGSSMVASSAVKHIMALYNRSDLFSHTPGPNGLIGGYPVRVSGGKVEVDLPEDLTLEEAIQINLDGQKVDGIEEIKEDGTAIMTDESVDLMKRAIGFECKVLPIHEVEERAKELLAKYKEATQK